MSELKKVLLVLGGVAVAAIGALFIKNTLEENSLQVLPKEQLIRILKLVRKDKYILYKQIATFALNIIQQTRANNPEMIEQFISGPESPLKISEEIQKITNNACQAVGTTLNTYNYSLQKLSNDQEIAGYLRQAEADYKTTLTGKLPAYQVRVPDNFSKQKFYLIQNQITKKTYMQQVALLKKLQQYSEAQIAQNPALIKDIGNPDAQHEQILREEGLGSQFEPALAVYEQIGIKFRLDPQFRLSIQRLEQGYNKIIMKYGPKIQSKSMQEKDLSDLQDEIIFFEPQLAISGTNSLKSSLLKY